MAKEVLFNIRINVQDEKELKTVQTRMDQLIARQKELSKQNKKSTTEYQRNTIELKALRKEHSQLSNNLVRQNQLQRTQANTLGRVNAELAIQRQKIRDVVIGSQQFKQTAARIKELETKQRQYNAEIGRSTTFVGEYSKGFIQAFQKIGTAIFAVMASFRVFTNLIKTAITDYADFETGQLNVQSLLDQFDKTLESRSIGLMTTYGLKMEDINKAMFDAVSAGVPAAELMGFMAASAKLAISGVTDLTTATNAIAKAVNVYGLGLDRANIIADMFFTTQKKGVTTVALVASNFGKAAVVAHGAKIPFEEFMATFAGLTKVMDSTEETATVIKNVIVALIDPTVEAAKVFKDLEIETGLTAIQQNGLFNTFEKIIQATKENSDVVTKLFPNVRALTGALAFNEEKMQEMHEVHQLVKTDIGETSSATKAFYEHMDSLNKRMDITKGKIKEQSIALGKTLKPVWLGILEIVEGFIERVRFIADIMGLIGGSTVMSANIAMAFLERQNAAIQESEKETIDAEKAKAEAIAEAAKKVAEAEKIKADAARKSAEEAKVIEKAKTEAEIKALTDTGLAKAEIARKEREDQEFLTEQELESERFIAGEIFAIEEEGRKLTEESEKKHLENLDKLRKEDFKKIQKDFQDKAKLFEDLGNQLGDLVNQSIAQSEIDLKKFGKLAVAIALDTLQKIILMKRAEILAKALATPESIATFGVAGLVKFAIINALITAAFQTAKALTTAKMAKGGIVPGFGDKDTTIIAGTPGEGMINKRTMQSQDVLSLTGRPFDIASQLNSYKGFGIPFAAGGVIPGVTNNTYNQMNEATINSIVDRLNAREIKVYQNVHEVIKAQREIKVIQSTSEL